MNQPFIILTITTNKNVISIFSEIDFSVAQRDGLFLRNKSEPKISEKEKVI
jgi:hypothetical protein